MRRVNLLQSYDYASTICLINHQKPLWTTVSIDGDEAGLALVTEAALPGRLIHGWILDRGPLWLDGFGAPAHERAFFGALRREFPRRIGRRGRLIPEIEDNPENRAMLAALGYRREGAPGYETLWLDLTPDMDTLRAGLRKNWRHALGRAERAALTLEWDAEGRWGDWLLKLYEIDRKRRAYKGPPVKLLRALCRNAAPEKDLLIGRAVLEGQAIAAILILCHGPGATWQVGWNSAQGRAAAAHHLLLWEAVRLLKERGIRDLDLGGVNDGSAAGIKMFKQGMGGETVRLAGLYR